jgi:hypothetical protein
MLLWFFALLSIGFADTLQWNVQTQAKEATIEIELVFQDEVILRLFSTDNHQGNSLYTVPDQAEDDNRISGYVENVWLASGPYKLRVYEGLTLLLEENIIPSSNPPKVILANPPKNSTGVLSIKVKEGSLQGFSFAEAINGASFVPIDASGEWRAVPYGGDRYAPETISEQAALQWKKDNNVLQTRSLETEYNWFVRLLLFPISLALILIGFWALRRTLSKSENIPPAVVGVVFGFWLVRSVLGQIDDALLIAEQGYLDPSTSATLLHSISDSFWRLSEVSHTFNFPEGHSWLILGPNWLAYVLLTPFVLVFGPIVAYNIGIVLVCALNFLCAWLLARELGVGKIASYIASLGIVCSPVILNEIDKLSLDRAVLFPIPIFFLCVRKCLREENYWPWIIGTGSSIAALFFFQVYYGLYLLAVLPFLLLIRLPVYGWNKMLRPVYAIIFALVLMSPGLMVLQSSTGTQYESTETLWSSADSVISPLKAEQIQEYLYNYDPRNGNGQMHKDMSTPQNRLLAVISNAIPVEQLVFPTKVLMGSGIYWFFIPFVMWMARDRKSSAIMCGDILLLCVMSLGPFIKMEENFYQFPLPYYIPHLLIPSFDQLKHPDRYAFLAASISSIPLAFFLQGLFDKIRQYRLIIWSAIGSFCVLLWLFVQPVPSKDAHPWLAVQLPRMKSTRNWVKETTGLKVNTISIRQLYRPKAWEFNSSQLWPKIANGSALIVPVHSELPMEVYIPAIQNGIDLVNNPPHGVDPQRQLPTWFEQNAFLNQVLWHSGSTRLNNRLIGNFTSREVEELQQYDLQYIIVHRQIGMSQRRWLATEEFLSTSLEKLHEDENMAIWTTKINN